LAVLLFVLVSASCGSVGPEDPDDGPSVPPPGPHWSVPPIPLEKVARITPLGHNNEVLPVDHTYWETCDRFWLMPSSRPCLHERIPIRAPGDGVVSAVAHHADGFISIEGPPGLVATFGHVTPATGLGRGHTVRAGDTVATMFYTHGFDFGVFNLGIVPHRFVNQARIHTAYAYAQSPIAQYPEPLRAEMISRVQTLADPLGRLSYDQAGTAAGAWFLRGTPVERSLEVTFEPNHLFLGRLQERDASRILVVGTVWPGQPNRLIVIDQSAPSWEAITPASGIVALKAWGLDRDGTPRLSVPQGTALVEVLSGERIRVEWFDTHESVTTFTAAARLYER
jgi:hypothetical protein